MSKSHVGMFSCHICGEPLGIILQKQLKQELPRDCGPIDHTPCEACKEKMKKGIFLIQVTDNSKQGDPWPSRTGAYCLIKREVFLNCLEPDSEERKRVSHFGWSYITKADWESLGIPYEERSSDDPSRPL